MSKLTVTIPDDLHQKIREELEKQGITTAQFIEQAVTTFFEKPKGVSNMATRTLAFQVSEELLQRIKTFLARYEQIYHRKLSQKEFLVHLIERELDEAEKDYEKIMTAQAAEENADTDSQEPDDTEMEVDGEVIDTWLTDYNAHRVPISDDFLKLSDEKVEHIYILTEDAAPAGFEIASSVQFKLESVDNVIYLFVRENTDAEWVRADKRLIKMIDEATPHEDSPTPTPAPTPAATPAPTPSATPSPVVQTIPQTKDGFPLFAIVFVSLASATGIVLLTAKQKNALKETTDEENSDESPNR